MKISQIKCLAVAGLAAMFWAQSGKAADLLNITTALSSSDPTQTNRLNRNGVTSDFSVAKTYPGIAIGLGIHYRTYPLTIVSARKYVQISWYDPAGVTLVSAYQDSYDPANMGTNYLGDSGTSGTLVGNPLTFQVVVPAGHSLVVLVTELTGGAGLAHNFNLLVEGFSDTLYSAPNIADLTIGKVHTGNFSVGQNGATYTVTVGNAGPGATNAPVVVTDTIPTGLTLVSMAGTGWNCSGNSCNRSDALGAAGNYPAITVTVNVAANAPANLTNIATVSGGGETNTVNDTASNPTTVNGGTFPDLTLTKTHTGDFIQGQNGATYTLTASNPGAAPTNGTVTVTDTIPSGLTLVSMAGTGWMCSTNSCNRSDVLAAGASYPAITVTVNVAANAPGSVTNNAAVSGGGETNTANDSASNPTGITSTAPTKVGIFRSSGFLITEDVNGNLAYDSGTDLIGNFGVPGDVLIFGDWNGNGKTKVGIYRPGSSLFALDMNGNGQWDPGVDVVGNFGVPGDTPIVGDWTGSGVDRVGIYRSSTGLFALDVNGNLAYDSGTDTSGVFGSPNGTPVVGKWTNDGKSKIGIFRNGHWVLDANGNLQIDAGVDLDGFIGTTGDTPIVGDWSGSGTTKVGIYRPSNALFGLDYNGNLVWDNGVDISGSYGAVGDNPIVGDWTGSGVWRVGIFRGGIWALDINGNITFDSGTDSVGFFGISGDAPILGKW